MPCCLYYQPVMADVHDLLMVGSECPKHFSPGVADVCPVVAPPPSAITLPLHSLCASWWSESASNLCAFGVYCKWVIGSPARPSAPHWSYYQLRLDFIDKLLDPVERFYEFAIACTRLKRYVQLCSCRLPLSRSIAEPVPGYRCRPLRECLQRTIADRPRIRKKRRHRGARQYRHTPRALSRIFSVRPRLPRRCR
jgi:hypothetical protein